MSTRRPLAGFGVAALVLLGVVALRATGSRSAKENGSSPNEVTAPPADPWRTDTLVDRSDHLNAGGDPAIRFYLLDLQAADAFRITFSDVGGDVFNFRVFVGVDTGSMASWALLGLPNADLQYLTTVGGPVQTSTVDTGWLDVPRPGLYTLVVYAGKLSTTSTRYDVTAERRTRL